MIKNYWLILFICLGNLVNAQTTNESDKILGLWQVGSGKARIKITKYGDKFGGKIVWLRDSLNEKGERKVDKNNPDKLKKTIPLIGLNNLLGFTYKEKGKYSGGTIYDPENGSTYNCVINLEDQNTLKVRGYIGIQLIGRTDAWKRVTETQK
jgi:uncharacterized protein (DUF2147 family)